MHGFVIDSTRALQTTGFWIFFFFGAFFSPMLDEFEGEAMRLKAIISQNTCDLGPPNQENIGIGKWVYRWYHCLISIFAPCVRAVGGLCSPLEELLPDILDIIAIDPRQCLLTAQRAQLDFQRVMKAPVWSCPRSSLLSLLLLCVEVLVPLGT